MSPTLRALITIVLATLGTSLASAEQLNVRWTWPDGSYDSEMTATLTPTGGDTFRFEATYDSGDGQIYADCRRGRPSVCSGYFFDKGDGGCPEAREGSSNYGRLVLRLEEAGFVGEWGVCENEPTYGQVSGALFRPGWSIDKATPQRPGPGPGMPAPQPQGPGARSVGDRVEVEYQGEWYAAQILDTATGRSLIRYDVNGAEEWVEARRVRSPTGAREPVDAPAFEPLQAMVDAQDNCVLAYNLAYAWKELAAVVGGEGTQKQEAAAADRLSALWAVSEQIGTASGDVDDPADRDLGKDLIRALEGIRGLETEEEQIHQLHLVAMVLEVIGESCDAEDGF